MKTLHQVKFLKPSLRYFLYLKVRNYIGFKKQQKQLYYLHFALIKTGYLLFIDIYNCLMEFYYTLNLFETT